MMIRWWSFWLFCFLSLAGLQGLPTGLEVLQGDAEIVFLDHALTMRILTRSPLTLIEASSWNLDTHETLEVDFLRPSDLLVLKIRGDEQHSKNGTTLQGWLVQSSGGTLVFCDPWGVSFEGVGLWFSSSLLTHLIVTTAMPLSSHSANLWPFRDHQDKLPEESKGVIFNLISTRDRKRENTHTSSMKTGLSLVSSRIEISQVTWNFPQSRISLWQVMQFDLIFDPNLEEWILIPIEGEGDPFPNLELFLLPRSVTLADSVFMSSTGGLEFHFYAFSAQSHQTLSVFCLKNVFFENVSRFLVETRGSGSVVMHDVIWMACSSAEFFSFVILASQLEILRSNIHSSSDTQIVYLESDLTVMTNSKIHLESPPHNSNPGRGAVTLLSTRQISLLDHVSIQVDGMGSIYILSSQPSSKISNDSSLCACPQGSIMVDDLPFPDPCP